MIRVINQETVDLTALLSNAAPGYTVTYEDMSKAVGRNIKSCMWFVQAALKRVTRDHGAVFCPVRGVGYKRLENEEIPGHSMRRVRRIRAIAKRGVQELSNSDYMALSPEKKIEHNVQMSLLGAVAHASEGSQLKKLRGVVQSAGLSLPIPNALDAVK